MVDGSEISVRAVVAETAINAVERVNSARFTVGNHVSMGLEPIWSLLAYAYLHRCHNMNPEPPVVPGLLPMPPLPDGSIPARDPERATNLVRFQSELEVSLRILCRSIADGAVCTVSRAPDVPTRAPPTAIL
jgi:hypothetical protein